MKMKTNTCRQDDVVFSHGGTHDNDATRRLPFYLVANCEVFLITLCSFLLIVLIKFKILYFSFISYFTQADTNETNGLQHTYFIFTASITFYNLKFGWQAEGERANFGLCRLLMFPIIYCACSIFTYWHCCQYLTHPLFQFGTTNVRSLYLYFYTIKNKGFNL